MHSEGQGNCGAGSAIDAMAVLEREISGPNRSRRGDLFIARGCTAFETCRRHGRDFLGCRHAAVIA